MKSKLLFCLLSLYLPVFVFSQNTVTIHVTDQQKEPLEYPEISIPKKTHKIGTKEGTLLLSENDINAGDSIIVSHLGYETEIVLIDNEMINRKYCEVILYEKTYFLEPVIVTRNDFNAEAFFKKRKQKLLLPYFRDYSFNVDFKCFMSDNSSVTGQVSCYFQNAVVSLDSAILSVDSTNNELLANFIKRGSEINYLVANIFCHSKYRKRFYCDFKGKIDGFDCWEFSIRPHTDNPWGLPVDDEFVCHVSLDEQGYIINIETQLTSHSEKSQSYLLNTNYTLYRKQLVASNTLLKVLPNADNDESKEFVIDMTYANFQRR